MIIDSGKAAWMEKSLVIGRVIRQLLQTPWEVRKGQGVEGIGVGDGHQYAARFFLHLDSGLFLELKSKGLQTVPLDSIKTQKLDLTGFDERRFIGCSITEVVVSEYDEVLVLLSNGTFLGTNWHPSGNCLRGDDFKDWTAEDKSERFFRYWERDPVKPWELAK
jgi:hypothetical protein